MYEYRIYVRFIYCIPSCVLYVYVLIALFKERRGAAGQFYSLLMVQALLNVCVFINSLYMVQIANITNENSPWSGIYNRTPLRITSINYMSFFVSLYRMTVIVFPTTYVTIWNYGFPASVAITLLTPFISVHPLLTHSSHFVISKSTDCFDVISTAHVGAIMGDLFIFLTVLLVVTSLVNCVSVTLLFLRSKRYHDRAERNMFILAFLDFLIQLTFYVLYAIIYKRADKHGTADFLVPYASDVITFSNAYLLIILNKKIRRDVLFLVKCRGTTAKSTTTVSRLPLGPTVFSSRAT
ncbi:hypothetical protein V3C99_012804 [Haemonchus contortus]